MLHQKNEVLVTHKQYNIPSPYVNKEYETKRINQEW